MGHHPLYPVPGEEAKHLKLDADKRRKNLIKILCNLIVTH